MSGAAELLKGQGFQVQGSDLMSNPNTERLFQKGIPIFIGHDPQHLKGVELVIISSAISIENIEFQTAREQGLTIIHRSDILNELLSQKSVIAITGSHGKTTTTGITAHLAFSAGVNPTVSCGGILPIFNSNVRAGDSEWFIVEADESDGSFLKCNPFVGILTNVDHEHLRHYKNFEGLKTAYRQFLQQIPFYGAGFVCGDDPHTQDILKGVPGKNILTYGLKPHNDIQILLKDPNPDLSMFQLTFAPTSKTFFKSDISVLSDHLWSIPLMGEHNILNATAAILSTLFMNISAFSIQNHLSTFLGIQRRFNKIGFCNQALVIDDYAHHPTEIEATLKAAQKLALLGKVFAVIQPHRYSRLSELLNDYVHALDYADHVLVTPVYPAGEKPEDYPVNHNHLLEKLSHKPSCIVERCSDAQNYLRQYVEGQDVVVFMGAGSITRWAYDVIDRPFLMEHTIVPNTPEYPVREARL